MAVDPSGACTWLRPVLASRPLYLIPLLKLGSTVLSINFGASARRLYRRASFTPAVLYYTILTHFRLLFDSMDRSPDGQTGGVLVNWARAVDPTFTNIPSYVRLDLVVFCSPFIPPILALSPFPPLFPFPPLSQQLHFNT